MNKLLCEEKKSVKAREDSKEGLENLNKCQYLVLLYLESEKQSRNIPILKVQEIIAKMKMEIILKNPWLIKKIIKIKNT